jgi:hypothetical protein
MHFKSKYIKYKIKYTKLKNLINLNGGGKNSNKKNEDKKKSENVIKQLEKYFIETINKIQKFELIIKPSLLYYDENKDMSIEYKMNDKVKKLFSKKIKNDYNGMMFEMFELNFDKIEYDEKSNQLHLIFFPKPNDLQIAEFVWEIDDSYGVDDIVSAYAQFFDNQIEDKVDTWWGDEHVYFNRGELDNNEYLFYIDYVNLIPHLKSTTDDNKKPKNRPSPSESATTFKVGTIKKGNDGNDWIIVENKNKIRRWKKL